MGSLLFISIIFLCLVLSIKCSSIIYPSFTASNLKFIDDSGAFLYSSNETFKAAITNPAYHENNFYLCVIHVPSNTIIWSANRESPISKSGEMELTRNGITIFDQNGKDMWATPRLRSEVYALVLSKMGNLELLDQYNVSLWESFNYPTDTIVIGQRLPARPLLASALSGGDLSTGEYQLTVSVSDVVLQWRKQTYWKLSMSTQAYKNTDDVVEYMGLSKTGLYLYGHNGSTVVIRVSLSPSDFRVAKLNPNGVFTISSFSSANWKQEFLAPPSVCQIPFVCGKVGLCSEDTISSSSKCSCPSEFREDSRSWTGCVPSEPSYSFPSACNSTKNGVSNLSSSPISYLSLGFGMEYFANVFSVPIKYGVNLSVCQDHCSGDCSCLAVFYENSSGSCYVHKNELGSIMLSSKSEDDLLGYIKVVVRSLSGNSPSHNQRRKFPVLALVLLPFSGFFLLVALGFLWWRSGGPCGNKDRNLRRGNSHSLLDVEAFHIPGLPKRFSYEELEEDTDKFKNQIGAGGFAAVYKGILPDGSVVAVKKVTNLGVQGNKEFCTEIAVIGNIHHVNLVKLIGFCVHGTHRLLVYEYMNHGSLDRTLFGNGPVLEWQERFDIAVGTARGLAYLHGGCQQKIIHCDIKPENILLHNNFQAKISDFGLSKLLTPEQSSLFTTMRGTRGYLAPEWLTSSAISEKTDVYSFGMVLLELVSGRKNCVPRSRSQSTDDNRSGSGLSFSSSGSELAYFPLYALEMHEQGKYLELADPRLEGRVASEEVEKLVRIALCCVHEDPTLRPNMVNVVSMLEGGIPSARPRVESLNFLRFYGRRFTEASTVEEETGQSNVTLYSPANVTPRSTSDSHVCFSDISSQQISGPR